MVEPVRDRDPTLDVLRGFAMLGVLLANLYMLYSLRFATRGGPPPEGIDRVAASFMHVVVQGKAQTLLTCLFGFGFAAQLLRAESLGERVFPMYLRRLAMLFAIGWLHVLLLAWVDVTWGYALVGFALLAFLRVSNRTRVIVALVCVIVPNIVYAIPEVRPAIHFVLFDHPPPYYIKAFAAAARDGSWLEIARNNVVIALLWTFGGNVAWYLPWLLGRFLVGFVAGAQRWFEGPRLDVFRKLLVGGMLVMLPALVLGILQIRTKSIPANAVIAVVRELGLVAQTGVYVAIIVLLMQRALWRRVFGILAPVGRMPLTTYLMQSAICPVFFYGWGLGWPTPGPAACIALALAIFLGQIVFAHAWLRFFRFGPAEWLWRSVVYLRAQPMRG